jgi:hypothetical protein
MLRHFIVREPPGDFPRCPGPWRALGCFGVLSLVVTAQPLACEPILPLAAIFGGPGVFRQFAGIGMALGWLGGAVAIKCIGFIWFERQLRPWEAVRHMALANVFSSLIGLLVAVAAANPPILFLGLPLVYGLSLNPARRLLAYAYWARSAPRVNPRLVALAFPLALFVTWVLFGFAAELMAQRRYATYWALKLAYVSLALFISILLTSLWEESIVARLARRRHGEASYLTAVVRANYVTFGVVLLFAAVQMLPKRLHAPGFLAWLQTFSASGSALDGYLR